MSRFHPQGFTKTYTFLDTDESAHTQLTTYFAELSTLQLQPPLQPRPQQSHRSTPIARLSYREARRAS